MADIDLVTDYTPKQFNRKPIAITVSALRAALQGYSSTTYTNAVLQGMTKRDMIFAARQAGLAAGGS